MTDSKRVLVVGLNYAPEHAGVAPYTAGMARGLAQAGHRVEVVTGYPYYPQWQAAEGYRGIRAGLSRQETDAVTAGRHRADESAEVSVLRLRHYVPATSTGVGRIVHEASFAAHAALRCLGRRSREADVVIAVSPSLLSAATARLVARRAGAAFGVVVQDIYASTAAEVGALGGRAGGAVLRLESALLRGADGVVAVHDHFGRSLIGAHGVEPDRVTVIRNWTHIRPPTANRGEVRARLRWPDDRTVVLHAGNMGAKQDLTSVVLAARLAEQRGAPVHFVLLGDGARRAEVTAAADGVGTVSVLPPVTEAEFPDVLTAADVLLVNERPGLHTMSVPSKLTSYFAAGRPVVAASEAGSPASEEIAASGAGVLVPPGAPDALLGAVTSLGADAERSARLGANGRRYVDAVLGAGVAADGYARWVDELVKRAAR